MTELSSGELREIARSFVRKSMRIGRKADGSHESVWIRYNATDQSCTEFAEWVEEECWRTGAHTLSVPVVFARERVRYLLKPEEALREIEPLLEAISSTVDVTIFIGEYDDPNWSVGIVDRLRLSAPARQRYREILDGRKVRWAYFGWPVPGAASGYGCDQGEFRRIFFRSIRESFSQKLMQLVDYYTHALSGGDRVRVLADDGTDLTFSIKGRPILVDDAVISEEDLSRGDFGLNIPSGEVFVAPLETTAEGAISFERVSIPGFGKARNLKVTFEEGRIASFEADEGAENFRSFLDANTGDKDRIAELGIGCNPGAEYTGGSIIIDEKIYRTIHVAIGNNTGAYHGTNKASSHLDMIKDMRKGELIVDGKTVMRYGEPAAS